MAVDIDQALDWLNDDGRPSHLSPNERFWIDHFYTPNLDETESREIIRSLLNSVNRLPDPYEQAEIMTYCGVFFFRLLQTDDARRWMQQATDYYEYLGDRHRQAVTAWMLYKIMRSDGSYSRAFNQGSRARRLFIEIAEQHAQMKDVNTEGWYRGRAIDFTVDLISKPEDTFEWCFEFQGSRLSVAAVQVKGRLQEFVQTQQTEAADLELQTLLDITRYTADPRETGEAIAYCGVIAWIMERQMDALHNFRKALSFYPASSHEFALLLWMLGLAQASFTSQRAHAIVSLERAATCVDRLRLNAIRSNDPVQSDWYALLLVAMKRVQRVEVIEKN